MKFKKMTWGIAALLLLTCLPAAARAQKVVDVRHTRIVIPGFVEPNTPGAPGVAVDPRLAAVVTDPAAFNPNGSLNLNKAIYVRFFDNNRKSPAQTILILIPELESGAGSLGIPATEIVKQTGGKTEVWIIDRRSNLLEDLKPIVDAWNQRSVEASLTALRGYMDHSAGRGGFLANNPYVLSSFMTEWGLDVHLRDIKAVVEKARKTTPNVFLGGHSLGATMTQMFAAYDFGDTAGFKLLKGMVLIEPTLDPLAATPISDQVYFEGTPRLPGLNSIRNQADKFPPFFADGYGFGIVTAVLFQIYDLGVQVSTLDPQGTQLYDSGYMNSVLKYPSTNQVCMAINMDDEFQFQPIARVSVGFLKIPPGKTLADVATRVRDDPT
ncbi:MAG TPA: hypothetical protein VKC34_01325, partial [Blastocatellia bacterium]|nr:hypothetical protein [Blastocatellia bacterium]